MQPIKMMFQSTFNHSVILTFKLDKKYDSDFVICKICFSLYIYFKSEYAQKRLKWNTPWY